jgi:hypothetical protein
MMDRTALRHVRTDRFAGCPFCDELVGTCRHYGNGGTSLGGAETYSPQSVLPDFGFEGAPIRSFSIRAERQREHARRKLQVTP